MEFLPIRSSNSKCASLCGVDWTSALWHSPLIIRCARADPFFQKASEWKNKRAGFKKPVEWRVETKAKNLKSKVLKMDIGVLESVHIIVTIRIGEKKPAVMWEVFLIDDK